MGFSSDELGYLVDLGVPQGPQTSPFATDAEMKQEVIFAGPMATPGPSLVVRKGAAVTVRDGSWRQIPGVLAPWESMLTEVADAEATLEILSLRRSLSSWRFYDQFRTDVASPARAPAVATRALRLDHDGANLASAWASAIDAGHGDRMSAAVDRAFPSSTVTVEADRGQLRLLWHPSHLGRPLDASELSDGTLRLLLLVAALLPARPAPFTVLNEPESSLHPDLIVALADLIVDAANDSQVLIVTHSAHLQRTLTDARTALIELISTGSATSVRGQEPLDAPPWRWPSR